MIITLVIILLLSFTHPQVRLAFSVGTGIGISSLQKKINNIQANAIKGNVTAKDKVFLIQFYRTLANGAAITFVLSEASRLMHHYLDGSGKQRVYEKQKGVCNISGKKLDISEMEADHITPWHEGGKTIEENCQMISKEENRRKSGK